MKNLNRRIAVLSFLIVLAVGYLAVSGANLFLAVSPAEANTAPSGTLRWLQMGHGDSVYNWDFKNKNSRGSNNVDWGMRYLFHDNAEVDYIKDRMDGVMTDPRIRPTVGNVGSLKHAYIFDGPDHNGSSWDSDGGIKNNPWCNWNLGHMRLYANDGQSYNRDLGYYVVASVHQDYEGWHCTNKYRSREVDEQFWYDRIDDNLTYPSEYNWKLIDNGFNWRNGVSGTVDIDDDADPSDEEEKHGYESDGWGPTVSVPGDD